MKRGMTIATGLLAACVWCAAAAAEDKPVLKQLGLSDSLATKALRETVTKSGQVDKLDRLIDSLNQHLGVSFKGTRKFDVIAREDLNVLIKEQQIPVGMIIDPTDHKSLPGKIKGLDYMLSASITDFTDARDGAVIEGEGIRVDRRSVQATMVLKLYNTTTGALLEAIDVPVRREIKGTQRVAREGFNNGAVDDSVIEEVAVELANQSASRVVDIIFPAKVLAITDNIVTLNRGEGSGVAPNQLWEVFATGKELIDPDTGVSLGKEEVKMGEITITDVLPKFSKGKITGENRGIDPGSIVRRKIVAPRPGDADRRPPREP